MPTKPPWVCLLTCVLGMFPALGQLSEVGTLDLAQQPTQETERQDIDTLLDREIAINSQLSVLLRETTERHRRAVSQHQEAREQLDHLRQSEQAQREVVDALQGSLLLSRVLQEHRATLPTITIDDSLPDQIAEIRFLQYELRSRRAQLTPPEHYVAEQLSGLPADAPLNEPRQALRDLVGERLALISRLESELTKLLNEFINLQLAQTELQTTADALRKQLDEQLFWIPSNRPIDGRWLSSLPAQSLNQLAAMPWRSMARELLAGLISRPVLFLPLVLLIGVLLWRRPWIANKLDSVRQRIGSVRRDSQWNTPLALLFTLLSALPGTLLLALAGLALLMDARGQNASLGMAFLEMAQVWLVFYTAYRVLSRGGVAETHFHWGEDYVANRRKLIARLGLAVLAMAAVTTFAEQQPEALAGDVIGQVVVIIGYGVLAWMLPRLLWFRREGEGLSAMRWLGGSLLGLIPVGLIVAVITGYYYTALLLTSRLIDTLFLILLWRLVEAMAVRGLSLAAQRLAWQRLQEQADNLAQEGPEGGEALVEEQALPVEQANQQSLRLVRLALFAVFAVLIYWAWADLITLFSYLDRVVLYEFTSGSGDAQTLNPISLKNVLGAIAILVIAIILAGNLPGLLEMLVLSRLSLAQGSAYATTTLLSYVIFSIGFVATLGTLGVSWDKLQWLVAALGVGLGFGLQEIFANFVSGLIILFERPVRIGDVVTVNNISGTVRRIRIRATTMTDFDRKEIIIPNKVFVTGQLTNWSLTDTVTRVVVKVGVAYGSDLEKTRELLLQIADENPRVLKEPAPVAYFLSFGASTLDHELRLHVRELGDRNPTLDEINRRIDELFRANGIEIAFSQLDVHIRDLASGREQNLYSGPASKPPKQEE